MGERCETVRRASSKEDGDKFNSRYGNGYAWFTWDAARGSRVHFRSLSYAGRITRRRDGKIFLARTGGIEEAVDDHRSTALYGVKSDWTIQASRQHLLKFGLEVRAFRADYAYFKRDQIVTRVSQNAWRVRYDTTRVALDASGWRAGLYVEDKWRVFGPLTADAGLRYDRHSYTGEGRISPRAGLALAVGSETVVRAAWGRYYQAQDIGGLDVQDGVTGFRRAGMATHYVVGVERRLGPRLEARVEGYYKRLRHIRDRFENLRDDVEFVPEIEDDRLHLFPATGVARGIECYLKRDAGGRLSWWAAYAYAITRETQDALQGPQEVRGLQLPRRFDQPHTFSIDLIYRPSPVWHLSAAWQVRSGWPFYPQRAIQMSAPDGSCFLTAQWDPHYERYPPFHRLDVKAGRQFTFRRWRLATAVEVINLYNRRNVRGYDYFFQAGGGAVSLDREAQNWLPILPSLTVSAEF